MTIFALDQVRAEAAVSDKQWRHRLLTAEGLAASANDLGLGWFTASHVTGLWEIGLLRADLITCDAPLEYSGLIRLTGLEDDFKHAYCDTRQLEHRPNGYGSALQHHEGSRLPCALAFHRFKVFVLHHVERTLAMATSSTQYLIYQPGVLSVVQRLEDSVRNWTSSEAFVERFHYWNQVAEVAAVAETIAYDVVFGNQKFDAIEVTPVSDYDRVLRQTLLAFGKSALAQMRSDLAFSAADLDSNRSVHVLLRLMNWRERQGIKGRLGGAMRLLAMAECIRRAAEQAFEEPWPEEDEIGPGQWFPGARRMLYGNERVFDAPKRDLRDYLTQLGLDFGVKVRCYVEGATEYGALEHAIGRFNHIQLVDLSGRFVEKAGKGLAFVASLESDQNAGVFSVAIFDGDRGDNLRAVQKAARDGKFHGRFFVSAPDIETANFAASELIELAVGEYRRSCRFAIETECALQSLLARSPEIRNHGTLSALLESEGLGKVSKGISWGKTLMTYAMENPRFPEGHARVGELRPVVEAAHLLFRMQDIGFLRSLASERVDPDTGQTVRTAKQENHG